MSYPVRLTPSLAQRRELEAQTSRKRQADRRRVPTANRFAGAHRTQAVISGVPRIGHELYQSLAAHVERPPDQSWRV